MKVYYLILAVLLLCIGAYCCREWREDKILRQGRARCELAVSRQAALLCIDILWRGEERVPEVAEELRVAFDTLGLIFTKSQDKDKQTL